MQEEQARQLAAAESRIAAELATFQRSQSETLQHLANQQERLHQALQQEQSDALAREQQMRVDFENAHQETLHKQAEIRSQVENLQKTLHSLQAMFQEHQEGVRQELSALTLAQREALSDYQQTVDAAVNALAQEVRQNAQELEGQVKALEHQLDNRLINMTQTLVQAQQVIENVRQAAESHTQEVRREFQRQDALLRRYEQLLPLLPYAGQHLAIDQDLSDLEARLNAAQQQVDARIQRLLPLLDLLSEERLELLTRVLTNLETLTVKKLP
jgi:hypothetical protein